MEGGSRTVGSVSSYVDFHVILVDRVLALHVNDLLCGTCMNMRE